MCRLCVYCVYVSKSHDVVGFKKTCSVEREKKSALPELCWSDQVIRLNELGVDLVNKKIHFYSGNFGKTPSDVRLSKRARVYVRCELL